MQGQERKHLPTKHLAQNFHVGKSVTPEISPQPGWNYSEQDFKAIWERQPKFFKPTPKNPVNSQEGNPY